MAATLTTRRAFHYMFTVPALGCGRPALLGDSLAVELPALTRTALVRIQVPRPLYLES